MKTIRRCNECRFHGAMAVIVMHAIASSAGFGAHANPAPHVALGCTKVNADAMYGPPLQRNEVGGGNASGTREQCIYRTSAGRIVEVWFGPAGAEAILLPGENDLEVIYQVLHDSAATGTWTSDGRVWRHSDGKAVAGVIYPDAFVVGNTPWLVRMVENAADTKK